MSFSYENKQTSMTGGTKVTRKVIIKNGKGYKSVCTYKNKKKCYHTKKQLTNSEITMIKIGKFIPGLFNDISYPPIKTRKNKKFLKYYLS